MPDHPKRPGKAKRAWRRMGYLLVYINDMLEIDKV